jgi:pentatricopeptide repeat protein
MDYVHSSQIDEAWDILMEMRSLKVRPDLFTYNILINACALKQSVPTALELMGTMRKDQIAPDLVTYNSLIKVCSFTLSTSEV